MSVPERVMGTEIEYSIHNMDGDHTFAIGNLDISSNLPAGMGSQGGFLSNGGRLYMDVGKHMEYATPESLGPRQVTLCEIAGEIIVKEVIDSIGESKKQKLIVNKRLCDGKNETWGSHHNLQLNSQIFHAITNMRSKTYESSLLATHLATSTIFTGSGMYIERGAGSKYYLSQKRWYTSNPITSSTTQGNKGLINSRNEPHQSSKGVNSQSRLHIQAGEANISPWATWMQLGTASILIRCLENNFTPDIPALNAPASTAVTVATDPTLKHKFDVEMSGLEIARMSAIDIQSALADMAWKAKEMGILSPEEELIAEEWQEVVEDLSLKNYEKCLDRVDWILRRTVIERHIERYEDVHHELLRQELDLVFDRLGEDGTGYKLRRAGVFRMGFSDAEIRQAVKNAPQTRARTRGEIIKRGRKKHLKVDWSMVGVEGIGRMKYRRIDLGSADTYRPKTAESIINRSKGIRNTS